MKNSILFSLGSYIQLIQLWAGICLLFFYQPFFKKYPFRKRLDNLADKIDNIFYFKYQPTVPDNLEFPGYPAVDWDGYLKNIKNMAALSFCYCIFLLFYISFAKDNPDYYAIKHTSFLSLTNYAIILYLVLCLFNLKIFHTYWTPFIFIFVIFVLFFNIENIDKSHWAFLGPLIIENDLTLIIVTLITCLGGIFVLGIRLSFYYIQIRLEEDQLNNLVNEVDYLFNNYIRQTNDKSQSVNKVNADSSLFQNQDRIIKNTYNTYLSIKYIKFEATRVIHRDDDELSIKREQQLKKLIDERLDEAFSKHMILK